MNRILPVLAATLLIAACQAPAQPPTGPAGTPGPRATARPTEEPSQNGTEAIQLIDPAKAGATFSTLPGKKLTLVASAAATATTTPMRFSIVPAAAFGLLQAPAEAPAAAPMPYSAAFRETPLGVPGRRLSQLVTLARKLGSRDQFWINTGNSSTSADVLETCVLTRISENAYFYVDEKAQAIPDANLDKLVKEWEENIYPRVTSTFGQEARPGIDGEDKVFIVLSPAVDDFGKDKGLMGYFWSRDAIPGNQSPNSNQKEALFMTDKLFERPALTSFGTLAHEFQHLVNFSQKAARLDYRLAEETWLDEGLSMYAMEVAGYGLPAGDYHIAKDLRAFMEAPAEYSLTDWGANPNGFAYGQSYLFVRYLVDRYGVGVIKDILGSDRAGVACVEAVLKPHGTTFRDHFRAWAITNKVTGAGVAAGTPYNYKDLALEGTFVSSATGESLTLRGFQTQPAPGRDVAIALKSWGSAYFDYQADQPQVWSLKLGESAANKLIGATIVP